jgi:hypothetical protein
MLKQYVRFLLAPDPADGGSAVPEAPTQQMSFDKAAGDMQMAAATSSPKAVSHIEIPVPDSIKGKTFDLSDEPELTYADEDENISKSKEAPKLNLPESKGEEPKKKEEPIVEKKQATLNIKLPEKGTPKVEGVTSRDYSIFPEDVRDQLKKTSNESFSFIEKTYKEYTKLQEEVKTKEESLKKIESGVLPNQWYEHPDAWQLSPQAIQSQNRLSRLEQEESFWRDQVTNIQAGERYRMLKGWNQQGQLVVGEEMEPSKQAETDLFLKLGRYQSEKNNEAVRLNSFAQNYSHQYKAFAKEAEAILDKEWPWRNDDNHEGQKARKEFLSVLPKELHGNQGYQVAALLYSSLQSTRELLAERGEEAKKEGVVGKSRELAEPALRSPSITGSEKSGASRVGMGKAGYRPPQSFDISGM